MLDAGDFAGNWRVSRRIEDAATGQGGSFEGRAQFDPTGPGRLHYEEAGLLRLADGPAFEARRVYLWQFHSDRVEVFFEDGRPFHRFHPDGQGAGSDHPCGDDYYRVGYDFRFWPVWTARWDVTGPRKDYRMTGTYRRD